MLELGDSRRPKICHIIIIIFILIIVLALIISFIRIKLVIAYSSVSFSTQLFVDSCLLVIKDQIS